MQVIEVQFENIGNAAMSKIHLIHHSPGMFSFGTPSQGKRKDTLFDLPLHSESFCLMKCTQLFSLQILGLQPRISKVFLDQQNFFLTVGQNNFENIVPKVQKKSQKQITFFSFPPKGQQKVLS